MTSERLVRYAPQVALPAQAFLPGRTPRPQSIVFAMKVADPARWRESEAYCFGADLYNCGFAWEAHEQWEVLWRAPHDAAQKRFVQGLIQCAAAILKLRLGQPSGMKRLARRGIDNLERAPGVTLSPVAHGIPTRYMGLAVGPFAAQFRALATSNSPRFEVRPRLVLE